MENTLIKELATILRSQRAALTLVDLSRSTWHYRIHGRPRVEEPIPQQQRAYTSRISTQDRKRIEVLINDSWVVGDSVDAAFATAWDAGLMLASRRSWWRIAAEMNQKNRPELPTTRRGQGSTRRRAPQVVATGPGQVWSWDITDVKSPYTRVAFKVYTVVDIYSRMIIAWKVEERETQVMVKEMFTQAIETFGAPRVVHADNGAVMTSNDLKELLTAHGVEMTHNRPYVSNDNPYSESQFRTMKYRPDYPGEFATIEQARSYMGEYVPWYNTAHKHSGVALFSPQEVYDGTWRQKWAARDEVLQEYYARHPERFRCAPVTKAPEEVVGINHKEVIPV